MGEGRDCFSVGGGFIFKLGDVGFDGGFSKKTMGWGVVPPCLPLLEETLDVNVQWKQPFLSVSLSLHPKCLESICCNFGLSLIRLKLLLQIFENGFDVII